MGETVFEWQTPQGQTLKLVHGDLTAEAVDAIVNAANEHLAHGGGVAGAIVRRGGRIIQEESDRIGYVPVGQAAITGAGSLPAHYVIHAVGPRWGEGDEDQKLASALRSALTLADARGLRSIAAPAISSGIFGFPKERCAEILVETALEFLRAHPHSPLREIRFTLIDTLSVEIFERVLRRRTGETASA